MPTLRRGPSSGPRKWIAHDAAAFSPRPGAQVPFLSLSSASRACRPRCNPEIGTLAGAAQERGKEKPETKEKKDQPKKKTQGLPLKPDRTVEFTTDEGTWVSLDVSPDGKTIVFELLGDLYTVPIDGGEAKAITTGMAFDSQPSYSPDGKMIAFVSDRDGAENLWVAKCGRLGGPAADEGQAEPVRLAVVDARRRLRARLATAAAPLGRLRAVDVPRPRRLGRPDHQGQAEARRQARRVGQRHRRRRLEGRQASSTTPGGTRCSTPTTT